MSALQEEELVISLWDYLIERTNFVSIELKTFSVDFETHPVSDIPERRHFTEKQLKHSLSFQKTPNRASRTNRSISISQNE